MTCTVTGLLKARVARHRALLEHYNHSQPTKAAVELSRMMDALTTLRSIEEARHFTEPASP